MSIIVGSKNEIYLISKLKWRELQESIIYPIK